MERKNIMTVQDLINQLQTLNPNLTVLIVDGMDRYDLHDHQVVATNLHEDYEPSDTTKEPNSDLKKYAVIG